LSDKIKQDCAAKSSMPIIMCGSRQVHCLATMKHVEHAKRAVTSCTMLRGSQC